MHGFPTMTFGSLTIRSRSSWSFIDHSSQRRGTRPRQRTQARPYLAGLDSTTRPRRHPKIEALRVLIQGVRPHTRFASPSPPHPSLSPSSSLLSANPCLLLQSPTTTRLTRAPRH